jgi:CubicO group peptidase (beta-lactamase class C family)
VRRQLPILVWAAILAGACGPTPSPAAPEPVPAPAPASAAEPEPPLMAPVASLAVAAPAEVGMDAGLSATLDWLAASAIADRAASGIAIAVGGTGGWCTCAATARGLGRPARRQVTDSTLFDLASVTKVVATTTAAMILEEEGRLDLDRRVSYYLPQITDRPSSPSPCARCSRTAADSRRSRRSTARSAGGSSTWIQINARPLVNAPGGRVVYSDWDLILAQAVIERITGEELDAFTARRVFSPLGMRDTASAPTASLAPAHRRHGAGLGARADLGRGARPQRVGHGRGGGARGAVRQRARPGRVRADAAERRRVRRRAHPAPADGGALDVAAGGGVEPRAGVGHAVGAVERRALLRAPQLSATPATRARPSGSIPSAGCSSSS